LLLGAYFRKPHSFLGEDFSKHRFWTLFLFNILSIVSWVLIPIFFLLCRRYFLPFSSPCLGLCPANCLSRHRTPLVGFCHFIVPPRWVSFPTDTTPVDSFFFSLFHFAPPFTVPFDPVANFLFFFFGNPLHWHWFFFSVVSFFLWKLCFFFFMSSPQLPFFFSPLPPAFSVGCTLCQL